MMFWIVAATVLSASLFVLLRAMAKPAVLEEPAAGDIEFYRSQQAEVARQRAAGMIDDAEARAAEAEAARKLLSRSRLAEAAPVVEAKRSRLAQYVVALAVPGLALPLYLYLGAPHLPAQPLAQRTDINRSDRELARLIERLDAHLAEAPNDARGLEVAFPVYMRTGRFDSAVEVAERLLALSGPSAERFARLAEARIFLARGIVNEQARANLIDALKLEPGLSRARFYSGLAAEQAGDPAKALEIWRDLVQNLADGSERRAVMAQIARLAPDGGPTGAGADAVRSMAPADQQQAIRGMVDSLEARLVANGGSLDEWQRLLRALSVLGEKDRAASALKAARQHLSGNADAIAALGRVASELGFSEGAQP